MKIVDVEPIIVRLPGLDSSIGDGSQDDLVIKISTDEGITGIGEADSSPEVAAAAVMAPSSHKAAQGLRELLIGADPLDPGLWDHLYRSSLYYGRRGVVVHALSGIDLALWDIRGKAAGKPVSDLLGTRRRDRVRAYSSMLMPDTPEAVTDLVTRAVEDGFTAVKLGWGVLGRDADHDGRLAAAARDAAGDGVDLMIDAGLGYGTDVEAATRAAKAFAEAGVRWFEEPFVPDAYDEYAALAAASDVPIAAGEQECTRWGFTELIERGQVAVAQPDVARCGGLTEALHIADVCAARGVACVPHAWKSGIVKAASLHLNAVFEEAVFQECCTESTGINVELVQQRFLPDDDGYLIVPTAPGLGVELDDGFVARHRVA